MREAKINYKDIEFDVFYDIVEINGSKYIGEIKAIKHKGTCFKQFMEFDIDEGLIEQAIFYQTWQNKK